MNIWAKRIYQALGKMSLAYLKDRKKILARVEKCKRKWWVNVYGIIYIYIHINKYYRYIHYIHYVCIYNIYLFCLNYIHICFDILE